MCAYTKYRVHTIAESGTGVAVGIGLFEDIFDRPHSLLIVILFLMNITVSASQTYHNSGPLCIGWRGEGRKVLPHISHRYILKRMCGTEWFFSHPGLKYQPFLSESLKMGMDFTEMGMDSRNHVRKWV